MVRISANGDIIPDAPAPSRTAGPRFSGTGPGATRTFQSHPQQPTVGTGQTVEVTIDALKPLETALSLSGQAVELPPFPALGWHRATKLSTVVPCAGAVIILGASMLGISSVGRLAIIVVLSILGLIHVQHSGALPRAPAPQGRR